MAEQRDLGSVKMNFKMPNSGKVAKKPFPGRGGAATIMSLFLFNKNSGNWGIVAKARLPLFIYKQFRSLLIVAKWHYI